MKKKEIEAIAKQLLPDLPGFVYKDETLFIRPIRHIQRGIAFERSSDPDIFYVWIYINLLFVPPRGTGLDIGWRLRQNRNEGWDADAPNLIDEVREGIKREGLPFLSRIHTLADVRDAAMRVHPFKGPLRSEDRSYKDSPRSHLIAYTLAYEGEVKEACELLDHEIPTYDTSIPWQHEALERDELLKSLLLTDAAAAQKQLQTWEAETARNLGLEEFR